MKNIFNYYLCCLKGIYYTFKKVGLLNFLLTFDVISGHDFIGDDPYNDLTCKKCGYVSRGNKKAG